LCGVAFNNIMFKKKNTKCLNSINYLCLDYTWKGTHTKLKCLNAFDVKFTPKNANSDEYKS